MGVLDGVGVALDQQLHLSQVGLLDVLELLQQTDRQTDSQTDRQSDRHTDTQTLSASTNLPF